MRGSSTTRLLALLLNGLPGWILVLAGLLLGLGSLFADSLGIGGQPGVIGWKQIAGAAVGGLLAFAGGWIVIRIQQHERDTALIPGYPSAQDFEDARPIYDSAALRIPFLHELSELYRYRFLLWNLVSRDLKVRYKRSVLGFLWAMINPLLTMTVLLVVFTRLFKFQIEHYPIYILAGLLIWNLYAQGTNVAMRSVLDNSDTRKKIYIPASVFVAAAIGSALVNLLFALVPMLLLTVIMGVPPSFTWLLLPIPILQTALFAFGVGVIIAALSVFFADMLDIYDVLINAYFYLTPIIYPASILPALFQRLEQLNPLYHFMDLFRANLLEGAMISPERIVLSTLAALAITVAGWSLFTRLSDQFAYRA
jgi:ABC-2 type transport system permease protein